MSCQVELVETGMFFVTRLRQAQADSSINYEHDSTGKYINQTV